jgi:hypothetical protein
MGFRLLMSPINPDEAMAVGMSGQRHAPAPTARVRIGELRERLALLIEEMHAVENDLMDAEIEGTIREYASAWLPMKRIANVELGREAPPASLPLFDMITRSMVNSLPFPVSREAFVMMLKRHTQVLVEEIDGPMVASFDRISGLPGLPEVPEVSKLPESLESEPVVPVEEIAADFRSPDDKAAL